MGDFEQGTDSGVEGRRTDVAEWLLLKGDRFVIAVLVAAMLGAVYFALVRTGLAPLAETQPLFYAFSGLIAGNLTLITVAVSINQLLLSRDLKSPGELDSEIEGVVEYRRGIEDVTDRAAPAEPSGFLQLVVEAARHDARRLGDLATDSVPDDAADDIDDVVTDLTDQFDRVDELVRTADSGILNVLIPVLETNYAYQVRKLEESRRAHGDDLPGEVTDALDDLLDRLREIDIARQYFRSIYFQVELSRLSRYLFYVGFPAIGTALGALFVLTGLGGPPLSRPVQRVFFPVSIAIGALPVTVLFAYIVRTATVTERTAAITPFTTPEQES